MGTPFITLLEPSNLDDFVVGLPCKNQGPNIPQAFLDAMEVREEVFVKEQGVPIKNEFDADDHRACHWIVYASVNKTVEEEVRDGDGNVVKPRRSSTRSTPVGTIRLVPFPQDPHPVRGGKYWNNVLEGDEDVPAQAPTTVKSYFIDRSTTFHDGREPYVKLGRLAINKEFRGHRLAGLLVRTALDWVKKEPAYFNPSVREMGLDRLRVFNEKDIPKWKGLVCVHAQEQVVPFWKKWGFEVDEGMGTWWEEGIPHVGMFLRLDVDSNQIRM